MFATTFSIINHHVHAEYGISKNYHQCGLEKLGSAGKGNLVSHAIYCDKSYSIFKHLVQREIGIMIIFLASELTMQQIAIAFAGNTCLYANRLNFEHKMQLIIDLCAKLHKATGRKTQQME